MPVRMVNRRQNQPSSHLRFSTVQLEGTPFLGSIPQRRDPLNHGSFSCFNVCFFKHVNIWLFLSIHFGSVSVKITCSGCSAWGHYDYQTANQQGKKKGCAATAFQGGGAEDRTSCLGQWVWGAFPPVGKLCLEKLAPLVCAHALCSGSVFPLEV